MDERGLNPCALEPIPARPNASRASAWLALVLLAGCAPPPPPATPADARAAQAAYPGTTEADLDRGRLSYLRRCNSCHRLHQPNEIAQGRWPSFVTEMTERARLSPEETLDLTRYLVVMAR